MKKSRLTLLPVLLMLLTCAFPGRAQEGPQLADTLVGGEFFYREGMASNSRLA